MQELFDNRDMTGLATAISDGEISPREAVEFSLARLEERNPTLNAVVSSRAEDALAEVDTGLPDGPLRGIPFLVKDLDLDVDGLPTTNGSRLFADALATADSELVRRYRAAGLVIIGKTNTPEFGQNASTEPALFGPTRNPHRLTHSPGGSSGGSSAAIAAGIVPAANGSDGGGSIRIPAAATGLVGLKPSRGRVPAGNVLAGPLSVHHALTRSVRDSALLLDLTCAPLPGEPFTISQPARPYVEEVGADPGRLRIASSTTMPDGSPTHPDCAAVADSVAALLATLGHEVVAGSPSYDTDALRAASTTGMGVSAAVKINARLEELGRELREDDLEAIGHMIYARSNIQPATEFIQAMNHLAAVSHTIGGFFTNHDLLITPTMGKPTPPLGLLDASSIEALLTHASAYGALTGPFNVTGQPAISLPMGQDSTGMPVGVQIVAAFGREDLLIRVASQLEAAQPWSIAPVWPPAG